MRERDVERVRQNLEKNKRAQEVATPCDPVARIDALTRNARNTWFALLGLLVFVGITLMGVEHVDFYGVDRATKLPLVNVEVPTRYFFVAAPILTAAFYIYFHLNLIRLWDALGAADPQIKGQPLGDAVLPWLVTDAALHLRQWRRGDDCTTLRTLEWPATVLNLALTWGLGLVVLGLVWWMSMPARTFWMTGIAFAALLAASAAGMSSLKMLILRMGGPQRRPLISWPSTPIVVATAIAIFTILSYLRTEGPVRWLAPINMAKVQVFQKPLRWLPHDVAKRAFFGDWCKRENIKCEDKWFHNGEFSREWNMLRNVDISDIRKSAWHRLGHEKPDFRGANLSLAFLAGADLRGAQMTEANLSEAQLEGAELSSSILNNSTLTSARLEGAILANANLNEADLRFAKMQNSTLSGANMHRAKISSVDLEGANLKGALMNEADLTGVNIKNSVLELAELNGAILVQSNIEDCFAEHIQMTKVDLSNSNISRINAALSELSATNLSHSKMRDVDFKFSNMREIDLNFSTVDKSSFYATDMKGAIFTGAQLYRVVLWGANLHGAELSFSLLSGEDGEPIDLNATTISAVVSHGGALRFVDLTGSKFDISTDFRNAFIDGSVRASVAFRRQMGTPCQWHSGVLNDEEFFGHWRGWIEASPNVPGLTKLEWDWFAPPEWRDVTPIPPPEGCEWKTGPMPGADAQP